MRKNFILWGFAPLCLILPIVHHVEKDLGAQHSPDMFHVENEIVKGTSAPLASKTKRAREAYEKDAEKVNRSMKEKEAYFSNKRGRGDGSLHCETLWFLYACPTISERMSDNVGHYVIMLYEGEKSKHKIK